MSAHNAKQPVAVIGGGIIGVSCALALQAKGVPVMLIDRNPDVIETSYGNAGVLATSSITAVNNAQLWRSLPQLIKGSAGFQYDKKHLIKSIPWLLQYLKHGNRKSDATRAVVLKPLIRRSIELHKAWMQKAGISQRLRDNGWIKVFSTPQSFAASVYEQDNLKQANVETAVLSSQEIHEMEPALTKRFHKGFWIKDSLSVDSPGAVVEAYRDLFVRNGGEVRTAHIVSAKQTDQGFELLAQGETIKASRVVVAQGPWSNDLLIGLGVKPLPLAFERGYHQHYEMVGDVILTRPIFNVDASFVVSPMQQGYRITTGVEFAPRDAPMNGLQLGLAHNNAQHVLRLGEKAGEPWMGCRPTLPDSLPVIGTMNEQNTVWIASGHNHIGFSTGPATGELLAQLMTAPKEARENAFTPRRF